MKKDKKHDEKAKNHDSRSERRASKSRDRHSGKGSPRVAPVLPARLETTIESSPLVMIGPPNQSTGALLSTKIKLLVMDPSGSVTLTSWSRTLRAASSSRKPIGKDCPQCITHYDILDKKDIISKPTTYTVQNENFVPFQYLFDGHLPATTNSSLGSIAYELVITATTSTGETIEKIQPLTIQRAIPPGPPKSSIRIFPPTNLTGRVQLPPQVHPIGTFPVNMTLSGVVEQQSMSTVRWRLRKLMWRVEEHVRVISSPCPKHAHKVAEGKALAHDEVKQLGAGEMKTGWKTDFDTAGGEITFEGEFSVATKNSHKPVCNVESPRGHSVSHNLVVELIVAEEFCPIKNPNVITPTGAARVLRMQFALNVTERAGMGISWDEEMPPMYEDVPDSPPGYGSADKNDGAWGGAEILDYHGPELEYEDLEMMENPDPNAPPVYRERDQDLNIGLPMRPRDHARPISGGSDAGPSGLQRRMPAWTADELEAEPPQWGARQRSTDAQAEPEEDFGEGQSGAAAPAH